MTSTEQESIIGKLFTLVTTKETQKVGHSHGGTLLSIDVEDDSASVKHDCPVTELKRLRH